MAKQIDTKGTFISILNKEAWYDPRLVSVVTSIRMRDVQLSTVKPVQLCQLDTTRLMIGFNAPNAGGGDLIAPWPDVNAYNPYVLGTAVPFQWFKLFDYGPLIFNTWYGFGSDKIRVIEVYRTDGK